MKEIVIVVDGVQLTFNKNIIDKFIEMSYTSVEDIHFIEELNDLFMIKEKTPVSKSKKTKEEIVEIITNYMLEEIDMLFGDFDGKN